MNDEIKEILEDLRNKNMSVDDLTHNDKTKLLDYITNLQEEKEDYKSRCEKALDKLYCFGEVFDGKILQRFQKEMENILNFGDEE